MRHAPPVGLGIALSHLGRKEGILGFFGGISAMPTILILEDDRAHLTTLQVVIEDLGHETLPCGDLKTAAEMLQRRRPSLVLSDINIRLSTSFAFLKSSVLPLGNVPIVLMTANTEVVLPEELRPPRTSLLYKPLDLTQLRRLIHDLCK